MMLIAAYVVGKPLLVGKASTGLYTFDAVKFMSNLMGTRARGMGMVIMSAGGFAKYMDHIGASKTLVNIGFKSSIITKIKPFANTLAKGFAFGLNANTRWSAA